MPSPRIRPATPGDADALTRAIAQAYAAERARIPDLPDVTTGIAEDIAAGHAWVAEHEDEILGGMILHPADDHLRLANIALLPQARGTGLARRLIAQAEALAARASLSELRLTTHVALPGNVALYEHLGWQVTSRDDTRVHMARVLPG